MKIAIVITFFQVDHNLKFRKNFLDSVLLSLNSINYKKDIIINTNKKGEYNYVGELSHPYETKHLLIFCI